MPKDAALRPALDQPRRPLAIFVVIFVGIVTAVFAYDVAERAESSHIQASFERIAGERISGVEAGLLTTIGSLQPIASFFVSLNEPTAEKFRSFVTPLLASHPETLGFGWNPVVERAGREGFEAEAARKNPGFRIWDRDATGAKPAAERDRYFPAEMIEPLKANEKAIGFDIGSDPTRRAAIETAIATRSPQATGRITLVQETGQHYGFLVVYPAFDDADRLRGLAVGVFRFGDLFERLGRPTADFSLSIHDLAANPREAHLYPSTPSPPPRRATVSTSRTLMIAGRPWRFDAVATPEFVQRERGHLPATLLFACLFLAGNVVWLVDRRFAVEAEVRARTREMREARDEAREATRAKSDFLAAMSHEIRTPLNGVVALADHLMELDPTPQQRESLAVIIRSGDHLQRMINDILDFSKLDAKKFTLEPRPFSPALTARNAAALMERKALEKGLSFEVRIDDDFPAQVEGDPARLRQILLNLISNAIKFTQTGGVVLDVSAREKVADGRRMLAFTVRDTGPGMSEDIRKKLFTEFWQADTSIARRFGGAGLGLAISQRLAHLMKGAITVESAEGAGSAFTLRVPLPERDAVAADKSAAPEPAANPFPPPSPESDAPHDFSGRALLLAEDNATNRAIARTILARTGARIVEACDGVEAVAAASREKFDLILMDVHMPKMTGLEAARAIRALPAPFGETPIVALTASAFQEDRDQCREAGMNDFLAKPYRGGPLRDMVARTMGAAPIPAAPTQDGSDEEAPAFAAKTFAELGETIGDEDARALLRMFMTDAEARLQILEAELGKGELQIPLQQAHALKSAAAMMGLARFAALARDLEESAHHNNAAKAQTLGRAARAALEDARPQVEKILSAA